jgi:excisionase family DNA binding protein
MKDSENFNNARKRLTLKQMANHLNRCEKTFRKYVVEYKIPHIRLGRDMLFDAEEVEIYLLNLTMKDDFTEADKKIETARKFGVKNKLSKLNKSQNKYAKLLGIS